MKYLVIFIFLTVCPAIVIGQDVEDTQDNRIIAAERYLKTTSMSSLMNDAVEKIAYRLPAGKRQEFKLFMGKYVRIKVLEDAALNNMVKHFTVPELNALADFYGSPVGKSAMGKFGLYMADIMPVVTTELKRAASEFSASKKALYKK